MKKGEHVSFVSQAFADLKEGVMQLRDLAYKQGHFPPVPLDLDDWIVLKKRVRRDLTKFCREVEEEAKARKEGKEIY